MRHSVNQALVQAIQPFKHHLLGLVDQQAWSAPAGTPSLAGPSLSADTQSAKQSPNPNAADFQSLLRNMAREHDYNAGSLKKAVDAPASSSASPGHSSEQEDAPPRESLYYDDSVWSFEQDLVCALDSGIRHTVNVALAKAIQPIKQYFFDFDEQQGWIPGKLSSSSEEASVLQGSAGSISDNPDFEQLVGSLAKDHDYSSSATAPKASTQEDLGSSSSSQSPD
ncbi:hypothetical protein NDU88_001069 [Pleurodeles waltl]|uniref:Uncharacterized protein n=1 Tax=Pleurodeles waltl TaxID=8319 RepID=A0AAV7N9X1_PLEWA|nr:hypothetical protein NDU88_001069 [Pleurodeles waltl]